MSDTAHFEKRQRELRQAIADNDQRRNTSIANIQQQMEAEIAALRKSAGEMIARVNTHHAERDALLKENLKDVEAAIGDDSA